MQQLSGQDALFLHAENGVLPQHMLSINIYNTATARNGKVTYADIVAHFKQRLSWSAILRQRLVRVPLGLDQPYWLEASDYAVESHIQHLALPQQADWRALCKLVGQLHSEPLNKAQPLWEAYFIAGLDGLAGVPEGSFALVLKVHRAALNGVGGAELNNALHDLTPVPMDCPQLSSLRVDRQPSGLELIGRACGNSLLRLGKLSGVATQTVPALQRIRAGAKDGTFAPLDVNPKLRFNGKISTSRVVGVRRLDVRSVYRIKAAVPGATLNDVMLTVVAGALRHYLQANNELPENALVSGCPFDGKHIGAPQQNSKAVGLMNVSLCSDISSPLQRLVAVQQAALQSRAFAQALGDRLTVAAAEALPAPLFSGLVNLSRRSGIFLQAVAAARHTVVTTVPGLQRRQFLAGAQFVTGFNAGPLLAGVGLVHTVTTKPAAEEGEIALAFTACPTLLPDPQHYQQCLQTAFDELVVATRQGARQAA